MLLCQYIYPFVYSNIYGSNTQRMKSIKTKNTNPCSIIIIFDVKIYPERRAICVIDCSQINQIYQNIYVLNG